MYPFLHSGLELNYIYKAAHVLNMKSLRNNIAAFLACKVYVPLDINALKKKQQELGIKRDLTADLIIELRENYPSHVM